MSKTSIYAIVLVFLSITLHAQSWRWGKSGNAAVGAGFVESWAVTTDARGNSFGAGVNDAGSPITFGGTTSVPCTGTPSYQVVWAKFDTAGNVLWASGTQKRNAQLNNITTDTAGNLIVYGYFYDSIELGTTVLHATSTGLQQYFLAKFDPSGALLWAVRDGSISTVSIGGTGAVTTDDAGNIYITGNYEADSIFIGTYTLYNLSTTGSTDMFVAKYSSSGSVVWATSMGGSGNDQVRDIAVASTGYVYVAGNIRSSSITLGSSVCTCPYALGIGVAFIAKLSSSGVPLWGQVAGGHPSWAMSYGLSADDAGNVYMTGPFMDDTIAFGNAKVVKTYPGTAVAAGFIVRYTPADTVDWVKSIGSTGGLSPYAVSVDRCGWVWFVSPYHAAVNLDGHMLAAPTAPEPVFIAGYDLFSPAVEYAGIASGGDDISKIATDRNGNVFFCGDYQVAGLVFGPDTLSYTSGEPFFIAKYNPAVVCCPVFSPLSASITAIGGDTVCPDSTVTITASHTGGSSLVAYQWVVNGAPVGTDTSAYSYVPASGDVVYCIITSLSPCVAPDTAISNTIHLSTLSFESAGIFITPPIDTLCIGDSATFTATAAFGGASPLLQWKVNGVNAGTGSTLTFLPHLGIDTVWCDLTSSFSCLSSRTATSNKVFVFVKVCEGAVPLINADAIQIAPNPATKEFVIHSTAVLPYGSKAELIDVTGRTVSTYSLSGRTNTIPVSTLAPGIYLCRITAASGDVVIKRIAVEQ